MINVVEVFEQGEEKKFRIKIDYKTLLVLFFPLAFGIFLYFLLIPTNIIILVVSAIYIAIFLMNFFSWKASRKDDMMRCWEYAKNFWFKMKGENLIIENSRAFCRVFGSEKFFAFVVDREKGGPKVVIVVNANGPEIRDWDDNPSPEKIENPFIDISPILVGAPSHTIKPELEPTLRWKTFSQQVKKREEEIEEEEEGEEE